MEIKIMEKEHILRVAEIENEAFNMENAYALLEKELENKISVYFIAEEDGDIKGYVGIWNICGEADIINIAVKKEERQKGVGSLLINNLTEYCKNNNISYLNLEVRQSNLVARSFYEKMGFEIVGERKNYYDKKETAVLMGKKIFP